MAGPFTALALVETWPEADALRRFLAALLIVLVDVAALTVIHVAVSVLYRLRMSAESSLQISTGGSPRPPVAVLLCVRDDWMEIAALSCIRAMGPDDRLFVCDDSQFQQSISQVDAFCAGHRERAVVVRRGSLEHFKAGNLNHCLDVVSTTFP